MFTLRAFGPPRPARAKRLPLFKRRLLDVIRNNKGGGEGEEGTIKRKRRLSGSGLTEDSQTYTPVEINF